MSCIAVSFLLLSIVSARADAAGFVGFGDSNTAGTYFQSYGYNLNHRWVVLTGAVNAGISGNHTNQAMKRFNSDVIGKKPASVSIMFGQNDGLLLDNGRPQVDKAKFEQNITSMVTQLKAKKIKVLLMTSIPVHQTLYYLKYPEKKQLYVDKGGIRLWLNSYNEVIRKVAKAQKVQLVDNYANAWIKAGGGAGSDAQLTKSGLIAPDGFHWTPKGHSMMAYSIKYYLAR